jgi:ribonuclease PH
VQVVNDSGALLAAITNAVCLALLDCGVAMNYVFAGHCCGIITDADSGEESVVLDLSTAEQLVRRADDRCGHCPSICLLLVTLCLYLPTCYLPMCPPLCIAA